MPDCNCAAFAQYAATMTTASTQRKPGLLARLFGPRADGMAALYAAVVAEARKPEWYSKYGVPDTLDGRFDMVTLVLCLVLLRLENEGRDRESVRLTERFVDDMDGQIREIGFGDLVVGKQVGGIMSVLGGRLGVYRSGLDSATLERTLWRGVPPSETVISEALLRAQQIRNELLALDVEDILAGRLA